LELRDGTLYDYPGNYSRFIEKREEALKSGARDAAASEAENRAARPAGAPKSASATAENRKKRQQEALERNRLYRERKAVMDRIEPLEKSITGAEARRDEIDALLCRADILSDSAKVRELFLERGALTEKVESGYKEWERLSEALEGVN
jgi:ATP-binding cassette subfamily F protein 3